jgi:hypothetical protein
MSSSKANPGSPLGSSNDRRRNPRHPCNGPIDFRIHGWFLQRGRVLNVCLDGCLIEASLATGRVPGDQLDLRFEVNHLCFRAQCIVRSVNPGGLLGIEILHLSDRNRTQLHELIAELSATSPAAHP